MLRPSSRAKTTVKKKSSTSRTWPAPLGAPSASVRLLMSCICTTLVTKFCRRGRERRIERERERGERGKEREREGEREGGREGEGEGEERE